MSASKPTFRMAKGGWVAHGPADQIAVGPLTVHKRDGSTCPQVALAVEDTDDGCRIAYLGRGCGKAHAPVPEAH